MTLPAGRGLDEVKGRGAFEEEKAEEEPGFAIR